MGKFTSLIVLSFLAISCAQTKVVLNNQKFKAYKQYSSLTSFPMGLEVMSLKVSDARENKEVLGMAKTGASYIDTPVLPAQGTAVFLNNYFQDALKKRNLLFSDQTSVELELVVNQLWVDELQEKFKGERAKCHVEVAVFGQNDQKSFKGNYWTKLKSAGDLNDGTEHIPPTLASCLNLIVEQIAKDQKLINFIKQ